MESVRVRVFEFVDYRTTLAIEASHITGDLLSLDRLTPPACEALITSLGMREPHNLGIVKELNRADLIKEATIILAEQEDVFVPEENDDEDLLMYCMIDRLELPYQPSVLVG